MARLLFVLAACGFLLGCSGPENAYKRSATPTIKLELRRASTEPVEGWMLMEAPGPQTLYVCPTAEISNDDLVSSGVRKEGEIFRILLKLNADAAKRFGELTESMVGVDDVYRERLAMMVDDKIMVTPVVTAPMRDGIIPVSGPWSDKEAKHMAKGFVSKVSD